MKKMLLTLVLPGIVCLIFYILMKFDFKIMAYTIALFFLLDGIYGIIEELMKITKRMGVE